MSEAEKPGDPADLVTGILRSDRRTGGLHWEDFTPGRSWDTATRVVTQEDVELFARVSGDLNPLHLDEDYARRTIFGGRIAHGVLGLAVATGLLNALRLTAGTLVAMLGIEWDFRAALRPGATVRGVVRVTSRRPSSDASRGIIELKIELLERESGGVLQEGTLTLLVRRSSA